MRTFAVIFSFLSIAFFGFYCSLEEGALLPGGGIPNNSIALPPGQQPTLPGESENSGPKKPGTADIPAEERTSDILPYQIDFDTVAYMNCTGDAVPNDSVFFTFKFGAYSSGLKLRPEFAETVRNLSSADKERKLSTSPLINSQAQLSLSKTGSPGNIAQLAQSRDVVETLALNHVSVVNNLVSDGVSYKLGHNASVELGLPYPGNSLFNLLPSLDTNLTVYLTYNSGQSSLPLSPGSGVYYGSYFNFDFNTNNNYLTRVKEFSLLDSSDRGNWECPDSLRFLVHRDSRFTRDIYKKNREYFHQNDLSIEWECKEDSSVLNSWEQTLFNSLIKNRTFVYGKVRKWTWDPEKKENIDTLIETKCIRPTDHRYSCYESKTVRVEFNEVLCSVQADNTKVCPSYLSICINRPSAP